MKRHGILNAELARTVASLGHGQSLVIGDAGLPVPIGVPCIDLAVTLGIPNFWDVLDAVMSEMVVESSIIAKEASAEVKANFNARLSPKKVTHETFKEYTHEAVAVVRTGDTMPYSNVILVSGVAF